MCEKQYQYIDEVLSNFLIKHHKKSLLIWLLGFREKLYSKFIFEDYSIKLNELLSINILIKRVMESCNNIGIEVNNEESIKEILSAFVSLIKIKEYCYLVEEDFGYFLAEKEFDLDKIESNELFLNFKFVYDEDWRIVIESFDQNLIMTHESAKEFLENHKSEYGSVRDDLNGGEIKTPEENIRNLYPLLQSFRIGLTKNQLFAEMFNFDYFEDKKILTELFSKVSNNFEFIQGLLTLASKHEFKQFLCSEFKDLDQNKLYNDLVYSETNQDIFPLFVELDDKVVISPFFINLIGIFYYSFYYNDLFNKETQLLSDKFEKIDVPKKFHDNGFNVRINIENKNALEIDTIAWNSSTLYVIESKIWDVKPFFEHRRVHTYRERDLKGIVDGLKYTGEKAKPIPSLIDKIDYVKNNIGQIFFRNKEESNFSDYAGIDYNNITEVVGVIITKSYPPIKEYKNVAMMGFNEIDELSEKKNVKVISS